MRGASGPSSWRGACRAVWVIALAVVIGAGGCASSATTDGADADLATHVIYGGGAVAADHPMASAAGAAMLERGGNAVDAAVAASFCLSVVRPYSCGIGGGGFMVIHLPPSDAHPEGVETTVCYRERAPGAVGPTYYVDDDRRNPRRGPHAVGVPGTVKGLLHALEQYGTLDRATVLAPAIRAARDGYRADAYHVHAAESFAAGPGADDALRRRAWFIRETLTANGQVRAGDRIRNPAHARALELIARYGADAFYEGPIARAIVAAMEPGGGPVTMADLAAYEVEELPPLRVRFAGRDILCMPPPSSGGIALLQMLGILEARGLTSFDATDSATVHLVVEAMKHAFADRARWLADPAFAPVPIDALTAPWYIADRAAAIDPAATRPADAYGTVDARLPEDGGTAHISVIDGAGGAVACTETINLLFGSCVVVPGFGFALNDEMDDFTTVPGAANAFGLTQSDWNLPAPGKRPLSSMSPTIVLRDGAVEMVTGASGGPRIITATLHTILRGVLNDEPAWSAVGAPRFHHQWQPHVLHFESMWRDAELRAALSALGHVVDERPDVGHAQTVRRHGAGLTAASDPRKGGGAAGVNPQPAAADAN